MKCEEVHGEGEVLHLLHAIYGLVQAARSFYLKFVEKLKKIGFRGGYPDPCLLYRRNKNGIFFIAILIDDSHLVGHGRAIQETINDLENEGFDLKLDGSLDDYLSCEISCGLDSPAPFNHEA